MWARCRLPDWALCRSPNHALHWLYDCVLCWLPDCILCQLSLWLPAHGLPLNSLSSLSKLLCRAAAVSTTFWWAIHRAMPHKFVGLIPFCFQERLQPQQGMSAFAAYPEGRRGSPGLPFSFLLLHKRGTLVLYLRGTLLWYTSLISLQEVWYPTR